MTVIKIKDSLLQEYESLLFRKDELTKEANHWNIKYLEVFGDLLVQTFEIKVDCIKLKKMINYCVAKKNKNEMIDFNEMNTYINLMMQDYYEQLNNLALENKAAKESTYIKESDVIRIKKIYHRIARKIHPDMHPEIKDNDKIKELWNRVIVAYTCNNLKDIEELEIIINSLIDNQSDIINVPDIVAKIDQVSMEITNILNSYPYLYKEILLDFDLTEAKKTELEIEFKNYQLYKKELDKTLDEYEINRVIS